MATRNAYQNDDGDLRVKLSLRAHQSLRGGTTPDGDE